MGELVRGVTEAGYQHNLSAVMSDGIPIDIIKEIAVSGHFILFFHHGEKFWGKSSMFGNTQLERRAACANCTVSFSGCRTATDTMCVRSTLEISSVSAIYFASNHMLILRALTLQNHNNKQFCVIIQVYAPKTLYRD